ncbi:MAG: DNA primase [Thermovirgaceae bacterium]
MARDEIEEVRERLDIVEVIGDYLRLHRSGRNYRALCPFHSEKTPSFYVSPERQTWHCFGCGRGGDVFSFVMEQEGLSFPEALRLLADRAGVTLKARGGDKGAKDLYEIMNEAHAFYRDQMQSRGAEAARAYLARRGIEPKRAVQFELGWAPQGWDALKRHFSAGGIPLRQAIQAGLIVEGDRGTYDRFRGRILFPIKDVRGRVIALGGRIISGEGAKYINSPESPIYSKRSSLYLLSSAKKAMRDNGRAILVEGYMDALKLHLEGFTETVATLGTSLTEEQAALLKRFCEQCLICYDADIAGQEAAIRGMYLLQRSGLDIRVVALPERMDPDDLVSSDGGRNRFEGLLGKAAPLPLFHIAAKMNELLDETRANSARREIIEGLAGLPVLEANRYLPEVARRLGLLLPELVRALEKARESSSGRDHKDRRMRENVPAEDKQKKEAGVPPADPLESALCYLLWTDPKLRATSSPEQVLPLLSDEVVQSIVSALLQGEDPVVLENRWHETGERRPMAVLAAGGAHLDEYDEETRRDVLFSALKRRKDQRRFRFLKEKKARGEASMEDIREFADLAKALKGGSR